MAFTIAERTGKKHPFKDECAGRGWYEGSKVVILTLLSVVSSYYVPTKRSLMTSLPNLGLFMVDSTS